MPVSREQIYEALFTVLTASPQWITTGRTLAHWSKVDAQPALFLRPYKEEAIPPASFGLNPNTELSGEIWLYCNNGGPDNSSASTPISDLMDLVDATLAADLTADGRQTLGGIVFHCWREGETIVADGAPSTQSVAILPVNILVRDKLVPRPKVLTVTCVPASGTLTTGGTAVLTLAFNTSVTVAGGVPSLALSSGGTATLTGAVAGLSLAFAYAVGAGDAAANLQVIDVALNGATITDQYGKAADLSVAVGQPAGPLAINPPA